MSAPITIAIDDCQSLHHINAHWLVNGLKQMLAAERIATADLHVVLVDDAEIRRVNRDYLEHDWATDVISFSYAEDQTHSVRRNCSPRGEGLALDGELVVSVETALRQAPLHGWTPEAELLLYVVHGCLHLCGYDDLTDTERPAMRRRERELLGLMGLRPSGLEDEPAGE